MTTPAVHQRYGIDRINNRVALSTLSDLLAQPHISYREEPPGVAFRWHQLASRETVSPKLWMDTYLAAFAIMAGLQFVTLDRGFQQYTTHGLDLILLTP